MTLSALVSAEPDISSNPQGVSTLWIIMGAVVIIGILWSLFGDPDDWK